MRLIAKVLTVMGLFLVVIGPCAGVMAAILQFSRAMTQFRILGETGDPAVFAVCVGHSLYDLMVGTIVLTVGGLILILALVFDWIGQARARTLDGATPVGEVVFLDSKSG